jgi:hypothetical protein
MSIERKDNITIVSGYWPVHNKYTHETYCKWFENTLKINQRMYFFCDSSIKETILPYRENLETIFVEHPINKFHSTNFYSRFWNHPNHIPSTGLGKIWHEKINLMKLAQDMDGENATDFYVWYDAGASLFRNEPPPSIRLNLKVVNSMPHNKILYSDPYPSDGTSFYASTIHIMHKDLIDDVHILYYRLLKKFAASKPKDWQYASDKMIFTELMQNYPQLFCKIATGYGENIRELYKML